MELPFMQPSSKIPVTVLTGYLGAGKTTLLNHILTAPHDLRIAVVENEFGEVSIDHALVIHSDEEIFVMNNGCLCCTVRGDLLRILSRLATRRDRFDHILIETTGLADPGPVVQTFLMDPEMQEAFTLQGVVTLVDARHISHHWEDEAARQIAFADLILLNKQDLVSPSELTDLTAQIRAINSQAEILPTQRAQIPLEKIFSLHGFQLDDHLQVHSEEHEHEDHDRALEHEHAHREGGHSHDHQVSSVGWEAAGELDPKKLERWLGGVLQERGADIFRMKGVFSLQGVPNRVVFQGVHMLLEAADGGPWGDRPRSNAAVFIGRHLDRDFLRQGLDACLVASKERC